MARGQEAKARRKEQRKDAKKVANEMLDGEEEEEEEQQELMVPVPLPPSQQGGAPIEEDSSVDDDDDELILPPPRKSKKSKKKDQQSTEKSSSGGKKEKQSKYTNRAMKAAGASSGSSKGIKTTPLILLVLMIGTTLIPGLIFASDYLGGFFAKNNVLGTIGYKLGVGSTPKKRVLSFYEKHDPDKIKEVPKVLSKYYGDYPKLIKRLERKYQDYGYFLEWEKDEAPMTLALQQVAETRAYLGEQFMTYAPQPIKTAIRNMQFNIGKLVRKFKRAWKKSIWPMLEPYFGAPGSAKAQKRKDAKEFRDRKASSSSSSGTGRRRKNTEFRDDVEDEM